MLSKKATVYLVGAGPGDVGLITLRGAECLRSADVVVYDNLANELLLDYTNPSAERLYVGKAASHHARSQDEINAILVEQARAGKTVVRLKGGDPFVFGRGGEEAAHLALNRVPFEVVPGVTSAVSVPAYAGIPVTHRSVNGSLHIVTGHENVEGVGPEVEWEVLARSGGTIVFLMGVGNLSEIVKRLLRGGMNPATPIALIRWGTTPEQQTLVGTLASIVADVRRTGLTAPAVGVVGDVVNLRTMLEWAELRPLFGVRAAVTRPAEQSTALADLLRNAGAEVVSTPTIRFQDRPFSPTIRSELDSVRDGGYDWLVFTSAHAVKLFFGHLHHLGRDSRALHQVRIAAIGTRTADALTLEGITPDLLPKQMSQEGLAGAMQTEPGERVLIPRAAAAREVLEQELAARAVDVQVLPLYDTIADRDGIANLRRLLTRGRLHAVTFTSASTFEKILEVIKAEDLPKLFADVCIASIGAATSEAIRRHGLSVHVEAPSPDMVQLCSEISTWFENEKQGATRTR